MAFNGGLASILVKAYCHSMFKMVPDIVDVQLSKLSVYASGDISLSSPVILLSDVTISKFRFLIDFDSIFSPK